MGFAINESRKLIEEMLSEIVKTIKNRTNIEYEELVARIRDQLNIVDFVVYNTDKKPKKKKRVAKKRKVEDEAKNVMNDPK